MLSTVGLSHAEEEVLPVPQRRARADGATLRAREAAQTLGELPVTLAQLPGAGAAGADRCENHTGLDGAGARRETREDERRGQTAALGRESRGHCDWGSSSMK